MALKEVITIIQEPRQEEIYTCDVCGREFTFGRKCSKCGKDVCRICSYYGTLHTEVYESLENERRNIGTGKLIVAGSCYCLACLKETINELE